MWGRQAGPIRARVVSVVVLVVALAGLGLLVRAHRNSHHRHRDAPAASQTVPRRPASKPRAAGPVVLTARSVGRLPAPVMDPATSDIGGGQALLIGGLNSADVSVASVTRATLTGSRSARSLATALHDAAAAPSDGAAYLFGGGEPSHDEITRVAPGSAARVVGRLPAPASDVAAVQLDGSYYVVGGYTGTQPLDTIVRWRPGGARARVVAHVGKPLRYAAVAAVGHELVIAGGTSGVAASDAIYAYSPASGHVRRIGRLPRPLTHAAAATMGGTMFVIGGRGSSLGTQVRGILAIDPATGHARSAGRLPRGLSDTGAAVVGGGAILVAGGRDASGAVRDELLALRPRRPSAAARPQANTVAPLDVYAADRPNALSPRVRGDRSLIYVPNSQSNTVDEIDPRSYRIVRHFKVGALPQHVIPSYDLRRLWVANDAGNSLTPIDPRTGKAGRPVPVTDPYNMYFTPDGRFAAVMAERFKRIDFRDPHSMRLRHKLQLPSCAGVNHADFTADGRYMLVSCEFAGRMALVDVARQRLVRMVSLHQGGMPQDVKLSPDGTRFYVADMMAGGVWTIDARSFRRTGFIRTGAGAHGLYVSRDSRYLYVSNRSEGSVSLIDLHTGRRARKWHLPAGSSPDMGGVSADGRTLWLAGRYDSEVYAIDTSSGRLRRRIKVGKGPHGLCVFPQPGRYSLGHTGVFR